MKAKKLVGAIAPDKLDRTFWVELVTTLDRPLEDNEADVIRKAYASDVAGRRLDPGIIASLLFPQIRGGAAKDRGYLEVQATSLAVDGYEAKDDADVAWDAVLASCLVETGKEGR